MLRATAAAILVCSVATSGALGAKPDLGKQIQQRLARAGVGVDPLTRADRTYGTPPHPVESYYGTVISSKQSFQFSFAVYATAAEAAEAYQNDVEAGGGLSWEGPSKEIRIGRVIYGAFINATGYGPGAGYGPQPTIPAKKFKTLVGAAGGNF
jgi:hypothetical protein